MKYEAERKLSYENLQGTWELELTLVNNERISGFYYHPREWFVFKDRYLTYRFDSNSNNRFDSDESSEYYYTIYSKYITFDSPLRKHTWEGGVSAVFTRIEPNKMYLEIEDVNGNIYGYTYKKIFNRR